MDSIRVGKTRPSAASKPVTRGHKHLTGWSMDGGGRFAGPERGLRLMTVARALLGRTRLAAKPAARDSIVAPQRKSRTLFMLERLTPRGAGAAATLLILGGSAV